VPTSPERCQLRLKVTAWAAAEPSGRPSS
jgi:hypothetical protein